MRFRYRIKTYRQFMAFAFYPKTTLVVCVFFSAIVFLILCIAMVYIPHESDWYNIVFALTTGVVGSFFVSIIITLTNNYRHNKLAWLELQDFYFAVFRFKISKRHRFSQSDEEKEDNTYTDNIKCNDTGVKSVDIIQETWRLLPEIIPALKQTINDKKAFLSDEEIIELKNIMTDYSVIRHEIIFRIMKSQMMNNSLDHPDEMALESTFTKNVLEDMPDWIRKQIAYIRSKQSMELLTDTILSDEFILAQLMKEYDISQHGLDGFNSQENDKKTGLYEPYDENASFLQSKGEEDVNTIHDEYYDMTEENNRFFASGLISQCCFNIAKSMDNLWAIIRKKPFYGLLIEDEKKN